MSHLAGFTSEKVNGAYCTANDRAKIWRRFVRRDNFRRLFTDLNYETGAPFTVHATSLFSIFSFAIIENISEYKYLYIVTMLIYCTLVILVLTLCDRVSTLSHQSFFTVTVVCLLSDTTEKNTH